MSKLITLNATSEPIIYLSKKDERLAVLFDMIGEITYIPYSEDPFLFLLDTIIGQMLSQKAANCISKRVHTLCGEKITPETVAKIPVEQFRTVGVSRSKSIYILNLANSVLNGDLQFNELSKLDDQTVYKKITSIHGLGSWSAKMYLIFVLNRQNILPYEDGAFLQGYTWLYETKDKTPSSIKEKCKKWEPYSSIATRYLYKALDNGFTKQEFHLK